MCGRSGGAADSVPVFVRQHHCRHCGKIYCSDCVNRTVPSGPSGTMARVCEVCHTLLNRESAPYFSSEAPAGAD